MLFFFSPFFVIAVLVGGFLAVRFWNVESRGSRIYAVLCGAVAGATVGFTGTRLWCWSDRACRVSLGNGMAEVMTLFVYAVVAAAVFGTIGIVVGVVARRASRSRRTLFVLPPALLVASQAISVALAWIAF